MNDWDARTTSGASEGPQWVSAAEAADVAGITPGTVRYWARNGLIVSEVVQGAGGEKTLVRLDEVLQQAGRADASRGTPREMGPRGEPGHGPADITTSLPARTSELAPILKSIPEIMAQLTAATDRAARAETKVEFLSAQLSEMRQRLREADASGRHVPSVASTSVTELGESTSRSAGVGVGGWPAPSREDLSAYAEPQTAGEEGRETDAVDDIPQIDWSSGDPEATPGMVGVDDYEPAPATGTTPAPSRDDVSLEELWAQAAAPGGTAAPIEETDRRAVGGSGLADDPAGVDWHEPVWPAESSLPDPDTDFSSRGSQSGVSPGPGSTQVELYGRKRRRWFRRR